MAEDFDNHRRIFDRSDDLQSAAAVRAVFDVNVEDPFEQYGVRGNLVRSQIGNQIKNR
jgi:hypothetical protein